MSHKENLRVEKAYLAQKSKFDCALLEIERIVILNLKKQYLYKADKNRFIALLEEFKSNIIDSTDEYTILKKEKTESQKQGDIHEEHPKQKINRTEEKDPFYTMKRDVEDYFFVGEDRYCVWSSDRMNRNAWYLKKMPKLKPDGTRYPGKEAESLKWTLDALMLHPLLCTPGGREAQARMHRFSTDLYAAQNKKEPQTKGPQIWEV